MALRKRNDDTDTRGGLDAGDIARREQQAFAFTSYERGKHAVAQAFIDGNQWVAPSRNGEELLPVSMDRYEGEQFQKVTDNQLGKELRKQASRVLTPLAWEVPAQAADAASRQASHVAETVLRHTAHEHRWDELNRDMWYAGRAGGCSALYLLWDPNAEGLGVDDAGEEFGLGDIVSGVADVGEFAVEPGNHNGAQARWWVLRRALPPVQVQELYGLDELPAADASEFGALGAGHGQGGELTKVVTLFERPHGKRKGGVWTVVGGEIVEHTDWPFPFDDELNLEVYRPEPRRRRWTGTTGVWDALADQSLINLWESYKLAFAKDASIAPTVVDGAFAEELPAMPGQPIRVTPDPMGGFKPYRLEPPRTPEALATAAEEARARLVDKIGSSEVLSGEAPSGVTAGTALAALIEQANTATAQQSAEIARVWGRYASKVLKLYEAKVKSPEPRRKATVFGSNGEPMVPLQVISRDRDGSERVENGWRGEDLLGHTEAVVPLGRILPRNRAASQALADSLLAGGMIEQGDVRTYAAVAEIPPDEDWLHVMHADWERAERENWQMAVGRHALVEPFDDDQTHIESHTQFAKSARWELLSEEARQVFREHLQQHETAAAEKAGTAAAKAATAPELAAAPHVANDDPAVLEALGAAQPATADPNALPVEAAQPPPPPGLVPDGMPPAPSMPAPPVPPAF